MARYFFLSAREGRQPEVIVVLNSDSKQVQVPMRDEDVDLSCFFERCMTLKEMADTAQTQTWKVFSNWEELIIDHQQMGVNREVLQRIKVCQHDLCHHMALAE
ncbi:hypothetical protein [Pontibacter chitinilyticus]|uniref:hypothetical protein n=1 Tax=Pontibacter chitinilyticus TaxID=2674989 RepID=UPI00321A92AD